MKSIDENLSIYDLYEIVEEHLDDKTMFDMICQKNVDGLFQIESDLFKGIISNMKPTDINDIIVLTSCGRPGPLSAGMDKAYSFRKNGLEEIIYPLANIEDILSDTLGTIVYQEQCMLIAKRVAGFDDNQTDTYLRKALAKKKDYLMNLCKRWLIYGKINAQIPKGYDNENPNCAMYDPTGKYGSPILGGINNGYTEQELSEFWDTLKEYATYLFNLSHAACYSFITCCTAYLKAYYPAKYIAALLSIQEKEEKLDKYITMATNMGIEIKTPNINYSQYNFSEKDNTILYGFNCMKGVGAASIPDIIANRPYSSLEDVFEKVPKKAFNKRVGEALIKGGAFDELISNNRYITLNNFMEIRKDKTDKFDINQYNKEVCQQFEKEILSASITYPDYWKTIKIGDKIEESFKIKSIRTKTDKNGRMMAFPILEIEGSIIDSVVFSATYCKNVDAFDLERTTHIRIKGSKDDKGKLIISKVLNRWKETSFQNELDKIIDNIV